MTLFAMEYPVATQYYLQAISGTQHSTSRATRHSFCLLKCAAAIIVLLLARVLNPVRDVSHFVHPLQPILILAPWPSR